MGFITRTRTFWGHPCLNAVALVKWGRRGCCALAGVVCCVLAVVDAMLWPLWTLCFGKTHHPTNPFI